MSQQSPQTSQTPDHQGNLKQQAQQPVPPLPTVGPPQDGRQFQNIVEEQRYSEQRPTLNGGNNSLKP